MIDLLGTVLMYVALGAAAWAVVLMIAGRPVLINKWYGLGLLGVLALLELGLLAQAIIGIVKMFGRELDKFAFVGYLIAPLLIIPLAALWSLAERTRWSAGVVVIGSLAIPVLIVRLRQVWETHG